MPAMRRARLRTIACTTTLALLTGCSEWFFSGEHWIDRTRPVVLVETTGGVELGATTELGVLLLGRTAQEGPCRVRYFLGPTPMVDDGTLVKASDTFLRADIDLRTQKVRVLDRAPTADDDLVAMWTPDGTTAQTVTVTLARDDGVEGDVLRDPGTALPAGAAVLRRSDMDGVEFVGLVAGKATTGGKNYYVFAGVDRVREMLAVPERHPVDLQPKYRPDGISVMKPVPPLAKPPEEPKPGEASGGGGTAPKKQ